MAGSSSEGRTSRTRSVGTKITDEEYARLEASAAASGLTVGEWRREVLLKASGQPAPLATPTEETLLSELLALRTILLNLFYDVASGEPPNRERMQALIEKADGDKREKALTRLQTAAGRGE
jgi:hypothetical protein